MTKPVLPIHDLAQRHSGLTKAVGDYYTEAARVCFDRHHDPPVEIEIRDEGETALVIADWDRTDERARKAHANETDATEAGAYACVLAAVELSKGMVAVHRAETKTGADYYVAPRGDVPEDLENCIRLEVSGIDHGPIPTVAGRLRAKLEQAAAGVSNLPAMAGVVGFRVRTVMLQEMSRT